MEDMGKNILNEIEPRHIDEALYKMIEDGTRELTDELFFDLIVENPAYLATRLFQKKVAQWRYQLGNPLFTKENQIRAKRNLINIGRKLAHEDKGRPNMIDELFIIDRYKKLVLLLDKYFQGDKSAIQDIDKIRDTLKRNNKRVNIIGKRSSRATAIKFIEAYYDISHRKIETILKKSRQIKK